MSDDIFKQGPDYTPLAMVERAVRNVRPHNTCDMPRWTAVRDVFGYGSTTSVALCRAFGLDPHERVRGIQCGCEPEAAPASADAGSSDCKFTYTASRRGELHKWKHGTLAAAIGDAVASLSSDEDFPVSISDGDVILWRCDGPVTLRSLAKENGVEWPD